MPLLSVIRSFSGRRLSSDNTKTAKPNNSNNTRLPVEEHQLQPRPSCEQRASLTQECVAHSMNGILLPPPAAKDTHRRQHGRHISFDKTTEAHQQYKSLAHPRPASYTIEEPRRAWQARPAHWSRSYHVMYEGCEGPIIQDAMYMPLLHVLLPEMYLQPTRTQAAYYPQQAAPEAPMLPSIESFATIKHHALNDDFSLETFTPANSPPTTPRASPARRVRTSTVGATPRRSPGLFFLPAVADSPRSQPSPVCSGAAAAAAAPGDTPTRQSGKRVPDSVSLQAVLGLSLSVSTSMDSTANFALGVLVASESSDSKGTVGGMGAKWDSIRDLNERLGAERRRSRTAGF